jgi:ubiquinone/menaquinone biosynthesis C-methylase UbiE
MYSRFDAAFHTFYYTLINMIDISKAHNVLEIACGTGKLLPLAVNMKTINCKYLASDLS